MAANDRQVGGTHYGLGELQHWDIVHQCNLDYFQAQIIKYTMRHKEKNKLQDLQKAQHFLEKYIELEYPPCDAGLPQGDEEGEPDENYVGQDPDLKGLTLEQTHCTYCDAPYGMPHHKRCTYYEK